MKVLLLFPPTIHHNSSPPLSMLYLGQSLKMEGHTVSFIDAAACYKALNIQDVLKKVLSLKPDIIGITTNVIFIRAIYNLVKEIKNRYKCKIILGGPHASLLPMEALDNYADFVVIGEGEITTKELLKSIDSKKDISNINGISFKDSDDNYIHTPKRDLINNLDEIHFPDFDLADESSYPSWKNWGGFVNVLTSRGCPYNCTYCSRLIFGKKFRARTPDNVLEEIKIRKEKWGVENIDFFDDAFSINKDRINLLCESISAKKMNFNWKCATRADFLTSDLVQKMKEAGCISVSMGVESGNESTLKRIKKNISLDNVREALEWLKKYDIKATLNFMLGFPWENSDDIKKTREFMISISENVYKFQDFGILVPIPGTQIYEDYKEKYGYSNWWLKDEYSFFYSSNTYFPFYRRKGFDDLGLLDGGFFNYSSDVKKAIRLTINFIVSRKLASINNHLERFLSKYGVFISSLLYKINPGLESFLFKSISPLFRFIKRILKG